MLLGRWTPDQYNTLPDRRKLNDLPPELYRIYRDSLDPNVLLKAIYWPHSDAGGVDFCWQYFNYRLIPESIGPATLPLPSSSS